MKKYIITLAAMALAIGGSINFAGCGGPAEDPNALGESTEPTQEPAGMSEADKKAAKDAGFDVGNENTKDGTEKTEKAPEK